MKTKKSLILNMILITGIAFSLQSWLHISDKNREARQIINSHLFNNKQNQALSKKKNKPLIGYKNIFTPGETKKIGASRTTTCVLPNNTFIYNKFYIRGTLVDSSLNVSNNTTDSSRSSVSNNAFPYIQVCTNNALQDISTGSSSKSIYAEKGRNSNTINVYAHLDSLRTSNSSEIQPEVIAYHESSQDTLSIMVFYKANTNYRSQDISFDVVSDSPTVVIYLITDDPRTSRGTVTTVQGSIDINN